ncbi:hypothetical protein APS56_00940 [Pseudalgibacter alginicilyticus]|uniref:Lipocalin-like domain-containing protein n=1 Tax=Pseudalgibacter alginicilyticus TaxID=1736674 RepID=A0A0P0CTZ9_9FLAO|nr:hypothetical protein [Pseudalgibacter alginicilyticus]ALJ03802.1 hypothetical protein APS56_00940 [Pseudalgibacter alginicilyticus]
MKNLKNYFFTIVLVALISCSSDNNSDESTNNASGIITLSGEEASELGGTLEVGNIIEGAVQTGTSQSVTLLHKNINTDNGEIIPTDPANTFIIVTAQFSSNASVTKTVSMSININGTEYKFACSSPEVGTFTECGENFEVRQSEKKVIFDNTTVVNTKTDKILTMNGTITW